MKIGQAASGIGTATTINTTFVPQFLYWNNATLPQGLRVSVFGDGVICDLDTNGISIFRGLRNPGYKTAGFMIPLSDGLITGKNVEIVFTNGVAAAIDIYGISIQKGRIYMQSLKQTALASSGIEIRGFACLGLPTIAAGDITNVEFMDGLVQKFDQVEIQSYYQMFQNDVNGGISGLIDNFEAKIKRVNFTPAANETIYIMRYAPVANLSQNSL
jgi:hypothetical protein